MLKSSGKESSNMRAKHVLKTGIRMGMIAVTLLGAQLWATLIFPPEEYSRRRRELMKHIQDGAAVFLGAHSPANGSQFFQNNTMMYFCGVEIPGAVLAVDGQSKESTLFFSIDERSAEAEGIPLELVRNPEDVTGISRVRPAEDFPNYMNSLNNRKRMLYTMFYPQELMQDNTRETNNALYRTMTLNLFDQRLTRELQFIHQVENKFPQLRIKDVSPIVWDMRKYKSPLEIELMKKTGEIGVKAHQAVMQSTAPGVSEKALAALFEFVCSKEGAQGLAFQTIIMSGKNHAFGHYHRYDRTLQDGDFVILDAGPDYKYYNVDFSTAFPVNGKFTARQKELYRKAFLMREACLDSFRPGVSLKQVGENVKAHLIEHGLSPDDPQVRGEIRYGGYNHSVGMATHDVMATFDGPPEVLKPGFVFACDIQVIHPEEEIGVRLEDTIAITETGYINLAEGLPRSIEEVEEFMQEEGILQVLNRLKKRP